MDVAFSFDAFAAQRFGGISRYFAELHRGLLARGHGSRVLGPVHVNDYIDGARGVLGVRIPTVVGRRTGRYLGPPFERAYFASPRPGAVYHRTYYAPRPWPRGIPKALTVYDMIHELFPEQFRDDPTSGWKRASAREADVVLAISEATKRDLVELLGVPRDKVVVTYLGHAAGRAARAARRSRGDYLLYVGNRAGYKNFDRLLEAFASASLPGVRLVCFGGGRFTPKERARIARLGLATRVLARAGGDGALARFYASARAFVYPSVYEGFGLPPLEAMGQGCPVACSRGGSIPEVVGEAGVYFDPGSVHDIARALERVAFDEALRVRLVEAGRRRVRAFSWDATVESTIAAYHRLIG